MITLSRKNLQEHFATPRCIPPGISKTWKHFFFLLFLCVTIISLSTCLSYFLPVHYEGTLAETGEVFDTTHEDNSIFSFEVGSGSVIKAWDIALRTMKVIIWWYWCFPVNYVSITLSLWILIGWRGRKNYLQARICLWKCRFSTRYTTRVKSLTCFSPFLTLSFTLKIWYM